jgi:hypothetical protein
MKVAAATGPLLERNEEPRVSPPSSGEVPDANASETSCARTRESASLSSLDQQKTAREKGRSMVLLLPSKITTLTVVVPVRLVKRL